MHPYFRGTHAQPAAGSKLAIADMLRRYLVTTEQATSLKATLESMFDGIAKKQNIMEDLERIETLSQEIASTAPPMLRHYLHRRSYTKALDLLKEGIVVEDPDRPDCDH